MFVDSRKSQENSEECRLLTIPGDILGRIAANLDTEELQDGLLMTSKAMMERLKGNVPCTKIHVDGSLDSLRKCNLASYGTLEEFSCESEVNVSLNPVGFMNNCWKRVLAGMNLKKVVVNDIRLMQDVTFAERALPCFQVVTSDGSNGRVDGQMTKEKYGSLTQARVQAVSFRVRWENTCPMYPRQGVIPSIFSNVTGLEIAFPHPKQLAELPPAFLRQLKHLAVCATEVEDFSRCPWLLPRRGETDLERRLPIEHLQNLEGLRSTVDRLGLEEAWNYDTLPRLKTLVLVGQNFLDRRIWLNLRVMAPNLKNIELVCEANVIGDESTVSDRCFFSTRHTLS